MQERDEFESKLRAAEQEHEEILTKLKGEIAELHEARATVEQETQQKSDSQQQTEVKLKVGKR